MNDYYKILEITDEEKKLTGKAFNDAVSKHYKKLSLKWHPDRWVNGTEEEKKTAEEKFKEISEAKSVCPHCHGTGQQINSHQNGNMFFQNITICPHCNGTGNIINNPCTECHGSGLTHSHD